MHRIDTAGHQGNQFVDKDPINSVPGTIVDAAWLNAVQEEIVAVLAEAEVTTVKGNNVQLAAALSRLSAQHVSNVAVLRTVNPSASRIVYLRGHTGDGDGGHGHFRAVTGSPPGTWQDNGGTVLVPTGGDGSAAWVRDHSGAVDAGWFGVRSDATTSGSALQGTDDTAALQAAIDFARDAGIRRVVARGQMRLDSQVIVRENVVLDGVSHGRPRWHNTSLEWTGLSGSICFVNHGSGGAFDAWAQAAFILEPGAVIENMAFVYTGQDMTNTGIPTTYPPTIALDRSNVATNPPLHNAVRNVNFVNAYVGIDAWGTHGNLVLQDLLGWPMYRIARLGSFRDNDHVDRIHVNPQYAFDGSVSAANANVNWQFDNAYILEIGSGSWSDFYNLFAWNYCGCVLGVYQPQDVPNGVTMPSGGNRKLNFYGMKADSCKHAALWNSVGGSGETHYGIHIYGLQGNIKSPYSPSTQKGVAVLKWEGNATEQGGFKVFGGRVEQADADVFVVDHADRCEIHGFDFWDFGISTADGAGARLSNTHAFKIVGGTADLQGRTSARVLRLVSQNDGAMMTGLSARDHGGVVEIEDGSNTHYSIVDNFFDAAGTTLAVIDRQNDYNSRIARNESAEQFYVLGDADVDAQGLLEIPVDEQNEGLVRYTGTTAINGITPVRRGRKLTIRFEAAASLADGSGAVPAVNALRLAGAMSAASGNTLTLVHDNDSWYEVSRSVN
jgi:hypothetical protein